MTQKQNVAMKTALSIFASEQTRMRSTPPIGSSVPTAAVVALLGLQKTGQRWNLDFTGGSTHPALPQGGINALLAEIKKIDHGGHVAKPPKDGDTNAFPKPRGRMSIKPIKGKISYIIIVLSDDVDWQFPGNTQNNKDPFTFGVKVPGQIPAYFEYYWSPTIVDGKIAYFIVNQRKFDTNSGYVAGHSLNIHVEFAGLNGSAPVSVIIDPEIKWPDGSEF